MPKYALLCFICWCNLEISSTIKNIGYFEAVRGCKYYGRTRLLFLCVFHLIAKRFSQNEEKNIHTV